MRVLITGGAGFLGSHLTDAFIARGDEVFVLDTGSIAKVRHLLENRRFHYVHDTVFNLELIESLVSKADLVYHLAAVVGVEHYVADPYETLNVNVNGTQNVLRAAYKYSKRLVFSSTSEVYGRNPKVPWREDDDRVLGATSIDRWCYSTSKAVGEHFCFAYHKLGLPVTIVRYFNVYGPRLDKVDVGRLFTIFMGQLLRGADLTVVGDGKQTRCFTYVSDAIEATVAAGVKPEADGHAINIGVEVETTVLDFAKLMLELFGETKSKIKFVSQEEVYGNSYEDIPRRVPDNTKMRTLLGVTPKVSLREGCSRSMEWFRKEQEPSR
jgi:UDP-glucose 4-epimerase